ncbi:hypothetical protein EDC04DRAFT_3150711 [Pisolithus marmoratus]|nr:hypothetical protein EDC04DRAFT_3150711 [Pisolithus marmoratus]
MAHCLQGIGVEKDELKDMVDSLTEKRTSNGQKNLFHCVYRLSITAFNASADDVARKRAELERCRRGLWWLRCVALSKLAEVLHDRFRKERKIDDLNEAITLHRAALECRPLGDKKRYEDQGAVADFEEAVTLGRAALELCPPGHPDRDASLYTLACNLRTRFKQEADIRNLDEAIELHRAALELRPSGHPHRLSSLDKLARCLRDRYENQGAAADLEEAVTLGRAVLELRPPGHPDHGSSLYNLAWDLRARFKKRADMHDLEEAIELYRASLELHPSGHRRRFPSLQGLVWCLRDRYENQGVVADLEEAVMLGRAVLELRPPGHPNRGVFLYDLARDLEKRFHIQADMCNLDEAIELHRAALELRPSGHAHRISSLQCFALCLLHRYEIQGEVDDLEESIMLGREALKLCPPGHPNCGISLNILACDLRRRFLKYAEIHDLEEAIELLHLDLERCPDQSASLDELARCLSNRYDSQGAVADLEDAVTFGRAALDSLPTRVSLVMAKFFTTLPVTSGRGSRKRLRSATWRKRLGCTVQLWNYIPQDIAIVANFEAASTFGRAVRTVRPPGPGDHRAADLDEAIALEQEALQLLIPGDRHYDVVRGRLTRLLQMKIRSQVATPSSNALPVTHFHIKQVIHNAAFDTLKTMPTRLLHTHTGFLCNRDAQLSHFMSSQQYDKLLSSCVTCDPDQRMTLIHTELSRYFGFVMLSHRWGEGEPLLRDIEGRAVYGMPFKGGLGKLQIFCGIACEHNYLWAWSDTCCIDKDSSAELQEAIGSMFAWYRRSALTIVYLSDVPDADSFQSSGWFGRGWTLQELLAPERLLFYTQTWSLHKNLASSNHKADVTVLAELERATGIESRFLTNFSPGMDDARSKLQWASLRRTTRPEDIAYSLFGIFNIHLPVLYGESAENALGRLLAEIISQSGDISVLDWVGEASPFHSCFPAHITLLSSTTIVSIPT